MKIGYEPFCHEAREALDLGLCKRLAAQHREAAGPHTFERYRILAGPLRVDVERRGFVCDAPVGHAASASARGELWDELRTSVVLVKVQRGHVAPTKPDARLD